jgi:hypothetical protein
MASKRTWVWLFLSTAMAFAQTEEEPVRKAEVAEEAVKAVEPHLEPVKKAEKIEKPKTDTGTPIHPGQPVILKIETPQEEQVMSWETVDVFVRLQNYAIGDGGNRIGLILDNGSPMEHSHDLKPVILRGLAPGAHTLRVYAVRPDGKMLQDPEAWDRVNFYVRRRDFSNFQPRERPYLTVNLPMDGDAYPDAEGKVWVDFRAHNAPLGKESFRVKVIMNGVETLLSKEESYPLVGLSEGRHRMIVELVDEDGDPVPEIFARVERTFEIPRIVKAVNPAEADSANLWLKRKRQQN